MKDYEMVTILDPGLDATSFEDKTKFLGDKLTNYGGVIQNVTPWGKRKLAYDIAKKDAGYYVVFNFQIPAQGLLDFKESIRHDTEILRYLIVVKRHPLAPEDGTETAGEAAATEEPAAKERVEEPPVEEVKEPEAAEKVENETKEDVEDTVNEEEK